MSSVDTLPFHQHLLTKTWSLDSKMFVVTGGTRGIGLAVSRSLLAHGAGGVIVCSRSDCDSAVTSLQTEFPPVASKIAGLVCDISTVQGRASLVKLAEETFGTELHGLINNVGVNIRKKVMDQTPAEYDTIMRTNVDAAYFLCRDFRGMLVKAAATSGDGSAVVNVASAAGVQSSGTGAAYGMSKAAIIQFTKILAHEWAKDNVRVNAVAPWMAMTPMLRDAVKDDPSQLDKVKEWTPMHRLATVEEIAGPITFLCMPTSGYVTGQCLGVDGGLTAQGFDGPCVTPS